MAVLEQLAGLYKSTSFCMCCMQMDVVTQAAAGSLPLTAPQQAASTSGPKWNQRPTGAKVGLARSL